MGSTSIETFCYLRIFSRMAAAVVRVARAMVAEYIGPDWCAKIKNLSWAEHTVVPVDFLLIFSTLRDQNLTIYALFT